MDDEDREMKSKSKRVHFQFDYLSKKWLYLHTMYLNAKQLVKMNAKFEQHHSQALQLCAICQKFLDLQLLQKHFLLFFWLWSWGFSSLSLLFSNLISNFFTLLVPRPHKSVNLGVKLEFLKIKHNFIPLWSSKEKSSSYSIQLSSGGV